MRACVCASGHNLIWTRCHESRKKDREREREGEGKRHSVRRSVCLQNCSPALWHPFISALICQWGLHTHIAHSDSCSFPPAPLSFTHATTYLYHWSKTREGYEPPKTKTTTTYPFSGEGTFHGYDITQQSSMEKGCEIHCV